jgi:hypothetical protein
LKTASLKSLGFCSNEKVNKKANALFGKAEEDLLKKREIVQVGSLNPELTDADAYHVPVRMSHLSPCKFYYLQRPFCGDILRDIPCY